MTEEPFRCSKTDIVLIAVLKMVFGTVTPHNAPAA